jgi:hypothetical protein
LAISPAISAARGSSIPNAGRVADYVELFNGGASAFDLGENLAGRPAHSVSLPRNSADDQVSSGVGDGLLKQTVGIRPDELSVQEEDSVQRESRLPERIATIPAAASS